MHSICSLKWEMRRGVHERANKIECAHLWIYSNGIKKWNIIINWMVFLVNDSVDVDGDGGGYVDVKSIDKPYNIKIQAPQLD